LKNIPAAEPAGGTRPAVKQKAPMRPPAGPTKTQDEKQRRLNPIKLRQIKERQRAIEDEITRLEVEIADFEQALSHYQSAEMSIEIAGMLESRQQDMKNLLAEWEEVSGAIEANR